MKVLHVAPSVSRAYGGPTASLLGYSLAGREGGAEVTVAAPTLPGESSEWFREGADAGSIALATFPGEGRGAFIRSPDLGRWLREHAPSFDLVHVHGLLNPVSSGAARAARTRGVQIVIRPFGMLSRYTFTHRRGRAKQVVFRLLDAPNLRNAGGVHFTTRTELEQAAWHGLPLAERAFVVPPPVAAAGRESGTPDERRDPVILFLSRLHPVKSVETLLAAWPSVRTAVPGARLIIAGDGDPAYVASLRALAPDESVHFVGFVGEEEKHRLLRRATVFVLPSQHENFGVAVVEALAAGLPVVITPEVQIASLVEMHALGAVVERSPDALARAIARTVADEALRQHCRDAGPQLVAESFSLPTVSSLLMSMYRSVLAHPH